MRTSRLLLTALLLSITPLACMAQKNIQSAFNAIINCNQANITESHSIERDPKTNTKTGQSDIYKFVLPSNKSKLVKNVIAAFDKDNQYAYSIQQGTSSETRQTISLAVGDASGSGVTINEPDCEYIYALFMAPKTEDSKGIYRYAYAFNYMEVDDVIIGKIAVTYATTLKYRQQQGYSFNNAIFNMDDNEPEETWFETLISYLQNIKNVSSRTRIALATKAYTHINNLPKCPDVTDHDKNTAREILRVMISDKDLSDPMLNKLLNQCLAGIK